MNKVMMKVLALGLVLCLGSGCTGMGALARALAKDPAIVVVEVNTPYGKQKLTRVGGTTNAVTVSVDGSVVVNGVK